MPTSRVESISTVVRAIQDLAPTSVLDVGFGFGKYGFLCREYLEVSGERVAYGKRALRVDGIEVWEEYVTPLQRQIYDNVFIGVASEVLGQLDARYDLILAVDVLEHMPREQGQEFLGLCGRAAAYALVSLPASFHSQHAVHGNPHMEHICHWTRADLRQHGVRYFLPNWRNTIGLMAPSGDAKAARAVRNARRECYRNALTLLPGFEFIRQRSMARRSARREARVEARGQPEGR